MKKKDPAILALADGRVFEGYAIGAAAFAPVLGEVVFNTAMSGYQEVITDPSYCGQMVTMTCPHQGNYGVNATDAESDKLHLSGLIVRELEQSPSNWRSEKSLDAYLIEHGITGIEGVDTRALTRHIRDHGAQQGAIVVGAASVDTEAAISAAQAALPIEGRDLVKDVTCTKPYNWSEPTPDNEAPEIRYRVVAYDFGIKRNILRLLVDHGCDVAVVPANTPAEDVLGMGPDGVFLSNGPGDPAALTYSIGQVKRLLDTVPLFGICLGHQLMCLASGAAAFKMKFGHHGVNQPVMDLATGKVEITSQNHGFAIDPDSLPDHLEITHKNLNDGTVEGVRHLDAPMFSVQYHPEAAPGPHDSSYLFKRFTDLMADRKK